jgi:FAD/FMN-containing dehydrogenase
MRARAEALVLELAAAAVAKGGTVAAEHGIGKLKRDLLPLRHPAWVLRLMRAVKDELDPHGIFSPGNLFRPSR